MSSIDQIVMNANIENIRSLHAKLNTEINKFETLFKTSTKNPLTDSINKEDGLRDNALIGFVKIIEANTLNSDTEKANAAKLILITINNHGSQIHRLNLREETAVLNSLISEFETTPQLSNALSVLNVNNWVQDIKTYNLNCERLLIERAELKSSIGQVNAKDLKKSIMSFYKDLTKTIEAHIILETEGDYIGLKNRINDQIKDFNATLNLRR